MVKEYVSCYRQQYAFCAFWSRNIVVRYKVCKTEYGVLAKCGYSRIPHDSETGYPKPEDGYDVCHYPFHPLIEMKIHGGLEFNDFKRALAMLLQDWEKRLYRYKKEEYIKKWGAIPDYLHDTFPPTGYPSWIMDIYDPKVYEDWADSGVLPLD